MSLLNTLSNFSSKNFSKQNSQNSIYSINKKDQQDNSLKHGISSWSYKGSHDPPRWHLDLDDVNRSIICHLMYSPLSQKKLKLCLDF